MRTTTRRRAPRIAPYLFILPFFLFYAAFQLYPQIFSIVLSLSDYQFGSPSLFVGMQNFVDAFGDSTFWLSLRNVLILWIGTLPVQIALALVIALIMFPLASRPRGLLSGAFYLPVVTNVVAAVLVFQLMFDEKFGLLNYLLSLVGVGGAPWLTAPGWARFSTIIFITWKGTGFYVVYILAGLMALDQAYYESARLEGANALQMHWRLTIPLLKPILIFLLFVGTIAGWNIFQEPYLLFGQENAVGHVVGPLNSVLTPAIYTYKQGFIDLKFGYGASISLIIAVLTTIAAVTQFRLLGFGKEDA